ncbi:MAG: hypothetical protein U0694_07195 [Anaerolineae bacterium]
MRVLIFSTLALLLALLAACGTAATAPSPTLTPLPTTTPTEPEVVVMVITATPDPNSTATANATATYCAANACPTSTLNEDQQRATEIIEGATVTAIVARPYLPNEYADKISQEACDGSQRRRRQPLLRCRPPRVTR